MTLFICHGLASSLPGATNHPGHHLSPPTSLHVEASASGRLDSRISGHRSLTQVYKFFCRNTTYNNPEKSSRSCHRKRWSQLTQGGTHPTRLHHSSSDLWLIAYSHPGYRIVCRRTLTGLVCPLKASGSAFLECFLLQGNVANISLMYCMMWLEITWLQVQLEWLNLSLIDADVALSCGHRVFENFHRNHWLRERRHRVWYVWWKVKVMSASGAVVTYSSRFTV